MIVVAAVVAGESKRETAGFAEAGVALAWCRFRFLSVFWQPVVWRPVPRYSALRQSLRITSSLRAAPALHIACSTARPRNFCTGWLLAHSGHTPPSASFTG
jgi:hypothetical protein